MNLETTLYKTLNNSSGGVSPPEAPGTSAGAETAPLKRKRWLKMATGDVDRAGDILVLAGLDASNFLKNPQFLWQHGASGALVNTIGRVLELKTTPQPPPSLGGGALFALVEYASADTSPLAEQVFQMDTLGLLPANSIGFRPIEWEANEFGGHTFTKWELIECSKVELPMNPEAVDSSKSYSIEEAVDWLTA